MKLTTTLVLFLGLIGSAFAEGEVVAHASTGVGAIAAAFP